MNKKFRKERVKDFKEMERRIKIASIPIEFTIFKELVCFLENKLDDVQCNHEFRYTIEFLESYSLANDDKFFEWLNENGAFCDCEIIYNVKELCE
jgi:Protein of unknown function (DUF2695)